MKAPARNREEALAAMMATAQVQGRSTAVVSALLCYGAARAVQRGDFSVPEIGGTDPTTGAAVPVSAEAQAAARAAYLVARDDYVVMASWELEETVAMFRELLERLGHHVEEGLEN